jgi:hypothetical protein
VDGDDDATWRVEGYGEGELIQLKYADPVKVSEVGIIPGHGKVDFTDGTDRFYQPYVVRQASIEFSDGTMREKRFNMRPRQAMASFRHS